MQCLAALCICIGNRHGGWATSSFTDFLSFSSASFFFSLYPFFLFSVFLSFCVLINLVSFLISSIFLFLFTSYDFCHRRCCCCCCSYCYCFCLFGHREETRPTLIVGIMWIYVVVSFVFHHNIPVDLLYVCILCVKTLSIRATVTRDTEAWRTGESENAETYEVLNWLCMICCC